MNRLLQGGLIRLYRLVKATGGLEAARGPEPGARPEDNPTIRSTS
jgi:hypothetical protein